MLAILSIGQLFNVWAGPCGLVLIMTKHQKEAMWLTVLSSVISLSISLLLVENYGAVGVAAGTAIGVFSHNFFITIYSVRTLKIKAYVNFNIKELIHSLKYVRS